MWQRPWPHHDGDEGDDRRPPAEAAARQKAHGAAVANTVARRMVAPPHRDGGQAQYVQTSIVRRFAEVTGVSPLRWLTAERVRVAKELLESTGEPVEWIAHRTGFGTPQNLRQHFRRATSVSPQAYRRVFRSGR